MRGYGNTTHSESMNPSFISVIKRREILDGAKSIRKTPNQKVQLLYPTGTTGELEPYTGEKQVHGENSTIMKSRKSR